MKWIPRRLKNGQTFSTWVSDKYMKSIGKLSLVKRKWCKCAMSN